MYIYPATLTADEDDGGFVVSFRDVPEALTQGDTVAEALDNAVDALDEAVAGYILAGEPLPEASDGLKDEHLVSVPVQTVLKYCLRGAMEASRMTKVALGAALGVNEKEVRRILDPHHNTNMRRLEKALAATGQLPVIEVVAVTQVRA